MMNRGGVGVQTPNNQNGGGNTSIHKRPGTPGAGSGIKDSPPEQPLPTTPQQGGTTNNQTPNSPGVKERTMTRALPTPPAKKDASAEHPPVGSPPVKQAPPQGQPQQQQGQLGGGQSIHQRPQSAMTAKPPPQSIHQRPHTTHQVPQQHNNNNNPHGGNVKPAPHNNSNNMNGSGDHATTTPSVTFTPPPVSPPPTRQAKVLKNFVPQNAGQLSLHVGDTVVVLSQNTNGMWAGSHAGKVGEFPADHVELLPLTAPGVESKPVQGGGNVITGVLPRTTTPRRPASEGPVDPGQRVIQEDLLKSKEDLGPESEKEKMARMRQQVIIELINTEETYLKHLDLIITIFLFPLKTTAIVPETTIQTIFSNVEIIQNVNKEFFQNLENRMKRHSEISATIPVGDLFKKMGDYFKMYTTYCANHPIAVNTAVKLEETNPDFKNFLKICHTDKAVEGFRIYDYLIKPVQRICKYPLLIRELLKFTEPEHEDYPLLVDAQKKIDEVVDYINEAKRNAEGNQIVVDIQIQTEGSALVTPTRHLKKEGELMLHERNALTGNKPRKVIVFMFNDMLLVVRPKNKKYFEKDKRQKNCFTQKAHIHLGSARLIGISVEKESVENSFEIQYTVDEDGQGHGKTESVILSASSPEEERMWTKDIKAVIKEYQKKKYFELQKAKAEAMLLAEQQGQGGHNLPIQRSTSAVIDTSAISPRNSLKRMQSEPSMLQNINAAKNPSPAGVGAGNPGSPAPAAKPTTWSFSSNSTPTRVRRMDMGTQRSATAEILKNN